MNLKKIMAFVLLHCAFASCRTLACDIDFDFNALAFPYPPQITDVSNSSAVSCSNSFTVTATIVGQMQMKGYCDIEPEADCAASDWYLAPDPNVVPNPPIIQKATLYYYKNDDVAGVASVDMAYDAALGKYKAEAPTTGYIPGDDSITYYIVAMDSRGNVASQVPDVNQRPCPSTSSWDASLATPATNSCSYATSYMQCNDYFAGTPGPCGSSYAMNDKNGDVCGEPSGGGDCDGGGEQQVISGPDADKLDILGISAGADGNYICASMGLKAPTPGASDPAPLEGYLLMFFNPDMPDPNPGDTHFENAFAITYTPEAVGSDPTLVKVLWSGDCVTDPNTVNPLDCKLISSIGASEALQIAYNGGSLKYMVKKNGTGNPLAVPFNIIGSNTKQSSIFGLTAEINLAGGTAFWISDMTPGFAFYHTNKTVNFTECCDVGGPVIKNTRCSVDGVGGTGNVCNKSASRPERNVCKINFYKSLDYSFTDSYNVYRNTTSGTTGAVKIGSVDESGQPTYSFTDMHTVLDGKTYTYFITSYNAKAGKETKLYDASKSHCTVEDWVAPEQPEITAAATPLGYAGRCEIDWSMPAADPSLQSFYLSRSNDGGATYTPLNYSNPLGVEPGKVDYSWPDPNALELGKTYKYTVTATDLGGNVATSDPADCTPEDLKAPGQSNSVVATNANGKIGVKMDWQAGMESDLDGYNVYWCRLNNNAVDCRTAGSFSKLNSSLFTGNSFQAADDTHPDVFTEAGEYCFYVEACDNCQSEGTCPSNAGSANCSGFPSGGADSTLYVKCLPLTPDVEITPPAFPAGVSCEGPPAGGTASLSWNHVCHNADGTEFSTYADGMCISPDVTELVGYMVVFGPRGAVPDYPAATAQDIAGSVALGTNPELDHNNIVNNQEYCYTVYGIDSSGNFSMNSVAYSKTEVCCTPYDTLAPNKPVMNEMYITDVSCTPSWNRAADKETATYNVYRCEGTTANCATEAAFGTAIATGITEAQGLSFADFDVTFDQEYQYCVTAEDPSGNESPVVDAGNRINCGMCAPSFPVPHVTGVTAAHLSMDENTGAKIFWTKHGSDDGSGGYNVYRCSNATCIPKGTAIRACLKTVPTAAAPLIINGEPAGDWYYGVTYMKDCGDPLTESAVANQNAAIDGPISVSPLLPLCTKCIVVSSCTDYDAGTGCIPVQSIDTSAKGADGKFAVSGVAGYQVFLADSENNIIGESATTDSSGNYKLIVDNDSGIVTLSDKYKIVLKVPESDKRGVPCSPGFYGNDCNIVLDSSATLNDSGTTKRVSGLKLPAPGGGRAEIGNADCSNSVDVGDLLVLRDAFGSNLGDGKYKTYADFDGNGTVDVEDFLIFKKNFGMTLDAAPTFDATLCKP